MRIDARAGPHNGIAEYPRLNRTPFRASRLQVLSIVRRVERIWSSVMIHSTLSGMAPGTHDRAEQRLAVMNHPGLAVKACVTVGGWIVLHDLSAGRGNIDHVIVGPTGIYLLDSEQLGGTVTVSESGVTVRRLDDPDLTYQHTGSGPLLNLARRTHERILATTRINTWVAPVMVIWSDFPNVSPSTDAPLRHERLQIVPSLRAFNPAASAAR